MSDPASPASHCANCGHRLAPWDRFCSQCGQDVGGHPPSLWEFVHEWLLHYVAFEGKLWRSLWALLARPGFLTQEYLAGRKLRYVLPLRLLLTFGLLFFLALKLQPSLVELPGEAQATPAQIERARSGIDEAGLPPVAASALQGVVAQAAREAGRGDTRATAPVVMDPGDRERLPAWLGQLLERAERRFKENREASMAHFKGTLMALAPYAVLLSLPFFAGLLKLLYPGQVYGAHFVFALHLHAAWYLMLLLLVLLQGVEWSALPIWLWSNLYPLLALRRVNGSAWGSTLLRAALLALLHWGVIVLLLLLLGLAGVASVQ